MWNWTKVAAESVITFPLVVLAVLGGLPTYFRRNVSRWHGRGRN